jgi:diaminopimelate epimerase
MRVKFTKMHGLGNDFVVLDAVTQDIDLTPGQARFLADRHFGVGCDQILVVEKRGAAGGRLPLPHLQRRRRRGRAVRQRRALLRALRARKGPDGEARHPRRDERRPHRAAPRGRRPRHGGHGRAALRTLARALRSRERRLVQPLRVGEETVEITALSMGNPHAVQVVASVDAAPVAAQGPLIENHPRFPQRVNAGFMQVVDRHAIRLRVFERGAGETLACGTGACAAVVAGIARGLLDSPVQVSTRGGELAIAWDGPGQPVRMTGPAVTVFDSEIDI